MNRQRLLALAILTCATLFPRFSTALAQGTAFTYQGRLNDSNGPVTGLFDFEFRIFDAASAGIDLSDPPVLLEEMSVTNGVFTALLSFEGAFTGADRFLDIGVRPGNSTGAYTRLTPRQPVTSTPYALRAKAVEGLRYQAANQSLAIGASTEAMGSGSLAAGIGTLAGGDNAVAFGDSTFATGNGAMSIGLNSTAAGAQSFAGGARAKAQHDGSFVWGDNQVGDFASTAPNQFLIRAGGGVGINTNVLHGRALSVNGDVAMSGSFYTRGWVGINVTNPTSRLHVVSEGHGPAIHGVSPHSSHSAIVGEHLSGGAAVEGRSSGLGTGIFGYNASELGWAASFNGRVFASGKVGIGKIPDTALDVAGTVQATAFSGNGLALTNLSATQIASGALPDARLSSNVALRSGGNNFSGNQTFSSGSIGIGTGAPATKLHVSDAESRLRLQSTAANAYAVTEYQTDARTWHSGVGGSATGPLADKYYLYDANAGQTRLVVDQTGNVGVGTTSPAAKLHVAGNLMVEGTDAVVTANRVKLGWNNTASGSSATALGLNTTANGDSVTAMGEGTSATGYAATAIGSETTASGTASTAMGRRTTAAGGLSTAMGHRARANHSGSLVWADAQDADFASTAANQFSVRAQNGVVIQAAASSTALELRTGGGIKVTGAGIGTATPVFIHRATAANIQAGAAHRTTIDHPMCNGDPNAILIVTQNYNAQNIGNVSANHSVGVYFNPDLNKWQIFHQNIQSIEVNTAWNVLVVKQ